VSAVNFGFYAAAFTVAFAAILPAAAAEQCPPLKILASVAFIPSADGRTAYVPVEIAGSPKLLVLDSGSEGTIISQKVADELGLKTHQTETDMYGLSGAKTDRAAQVEVKLGATTGNLTVMVAPFLDNMDPNPQVAGLLGADVLTNFDVSIDFGSHKLDLLDKDHCPGKVVYWPAETAAVVPFHKLRLGQIVLDVELDGKTVKAVLDTGAENSILRLDTAERLFDVQPGTADTPEQGGLNERADLKTYKHSFKTLNLNGITVANPNFVLIPDMISKTLAPGAPIDSHIPSRDDALEVPILLGMNVLKHIHIYIAYKEQKIYITAASTPKAN
jgi:predicted aspartyl protease